MALAEGACLNHISRESTDIRRLANFYKEVFGFEEIESPNFGFNVIWLNLPGSFALHLIERLPETKLPESPYSAASPIADPSHLPRGHHVCLSVSNFDSFLQSLKDKGIQTFQRALPNGKVRQVFFFDPDDRKWIGGCKSRSFIDLSGLQTLGYMSRLYESSWGSEYNKLQLPS